MKTEGQILCVEDIKQTFREKLRFSEEAEEIIRWLAEWMGYKRFGKACCGHIVLIGIAEEMRSEARRI